MSSLDRHVTVSRILGTTIYRVENPWTGCCGGVWIEAVPIEEEQQPQSLPSSPSDILTTMSSDSSVFSSSPSDASSTFSSFSSSPSNNSTTTSSASSVFSSQSSRSSSICSLSLPSPLQMISSEEQPKELDDRYLPLSSSSSETMPWDRIPPSQGGGKRKKPCGDWSWPPRSPESNKPSCSPNLAATTSSYHRPEEATASWEEKLLFLESQKRHDDHRPSPSPSPLQTHLAPPQRPCHRPRDQDRIIHLDFQHSTGTSPSSPCCRCLGSGLDLEDPEVRGILDVVMDVAGEDKEEVSLVAFVKLVLRLSLPKPEENKEREWFGGDYYWIAAGGEGRDDAPQGFAGWKLLGGHPVPEDILRLEEAKHKEKMLDDGFYYYGDDPGLW